LDLQIACTLNEAVDCGQRDILPDFSLHLFVPANWQKKFHTCRPPKQFNQIASEEFFLKI
jgi:hypothetical protein